jgi:hypothetical protein
MAKKLKYIDVYNYFKENNCELLDKEYINSRTKLKYICKECNTKDSILLGNFKKGNRCKICDKGNYFKNVYIYFKNRGCKLLSRECYNSCSNLIYICKCGNTSITTFYDFKKGKRCQVCENRPIIKYICCIECHFYQFKKQCTLS